VVGITEFRIEFDTKIYQTTFSIDSVTDYPE